MARGYASISARSSQADAERRDLWMPVGRNLHKLAERDELVNNGRAATIAFGNHSSPSISAVWMSRTPRPIARS